MSRLLRFFLTLALLFSIGTPAAAGRFRVIQHHVVVTSGGAAITYDTAIGNGVDTNGFASLPLRSGAHRYYVNSSTGSDGNTCTQAQSAATPKATILAARNCITQYAHAGDQVVVAQDTTYAENLPSFDGYFGYSALYPAVFQSYDPADPTNEAKMGRATGTHRPVINIGNNLNASTCCNSGESYLAVRGFDFNPGNVTDGGGMSFPQSGATAQDYILVENNIFHYSSFGANEAGATVQSQHIIIRNNTFYANFSTSCGTCGQGIFIAGGYGFTIEDNFFYHVGWKEGVSRDDATYGSNIYKHSIYLQDESAGVIRRNLFVDPGTTGCSCRGQVIEQDNVFIDNPLSIIAGVGDHYNTDDPNGVDLEVSGNAILGGANISSSLVRGEAITTGNGRLGSKIHFNLIARYEGEADPLTANPGLSNVYTLTIENGFPQPSYAAFEDNVEYQWNDATHEILNTATSPGDVSYNHLTTARNAWSAAAGGTDVNISSHTMPNPYTEDDLYTALGFTGADAGARKAAFVAYAAYNPDAHVQRQARTLLFTGYGVTLPPALTSPTLGTMTLSSTTFARGVASSGTISGGTAFSLGSASGLPSGLTVDVKNRTWTWDGSGSGSASGSFTLTETLANPAVTATNSPHANTISYTITP